MSPQDSLVVVEAGEVPPTSLNDLLVVVESGVR